MYSSSLWVCSCNLMKCVQVYSTARGMTTIFSGSLSSMPNGRLIDFEIAEIRTVPFQDSLYLWVRGVHPGQELEVRLAPRYYNMQQDYWATEVAAIRLLVPHADLSAKHKATFECAIPLVGVIGLRGITVIGANRIQRIELPQGPALI